MTKVLVCGGRTYDNAKLVYDTLYALEPSLIIQGGAMGADRLAREYAGVLGVTCITYPAQWTLFGKGAGPKRNQQMLDMEKPDVVVAFKGGRGTEDMVRRAKKAGVPVLYVDDM